MPKECGVQRLAGNCPPLISGIFMSHSLIVISDCHPSLHFILLYVKHVMGRDQGSSAPLCAPDVTDWATWACKYARPLVPLPSCYIDSSLTHPIDHSLKTSLDHSHFHPLSTRHSIK